MLIAPPPHPGDPWEKTIANQRGPNGGGPNGPLGQDGPTFVASIGWDWVPGIRDRQIGIWQRVTLSATGPVMLQNPYVTTDLPLPRTDSADVSIEVTVNNTSNAPQTGRVSGKLGDIRFPIFLHHARGQLFATCQTESSKYAAVAAGESEALVAQRLRRAKSVSPAPELRHERRRLGHCGSECRDSQGDVFRGRLDGISRFRSMACASSPRAATGAWTRC